MNKKELLEHFTQIQDDEKFSIVYQDPDGEGNAEDGDVLQIFDGGYSQQLGHVLYVKKV